MTTYRYSLIWSTKVTNVNQDELILQTRKTIEKVVPFLDYRIYCKLPKMYIFIQSDKTMLTMRKLLETTFVPLQLQFHESGWGWSTSESELDSRIQESIELDPYSNEVINKPELVHTYYYNKILILLHYCLLFIPLIIITVVFRNLLLELVFLIGSLFFCLINIPRMLIKISYDPRGIIFTSWRGRSQSITWEAIQRLEKSELPTPRVTIFTTGIKVQFTFLYGLTDKESLLINIIQLAKLKLAEISSANILIYKRYN